MRLNSLQVLRLRGVSDANLSLSEGVNWIVGGNAAGKTTLLEAVFLLGRGKSFRGSRYGGLVQRGRRDAQVYADVVVGGRGRRIGVIKTSDGVHWWENGVRRGSLDDLGLRVNVRVIGENAQRLVEGDPDLRRRFLDWNVFHVEPGYRETYARFRRILAQRNAWLRLGGRGSALWDTAYSTVAEEVTRQRRSFVSAMAEGFGEISAACGLGQEVSVEFTRGWPEGEGLISCLQRTKPADVERGYTWYGPGRGDLVVRVDGCAAVGSRGQNKIAVAALQLAAQRVWTQAGMECVWLLDDLGAELSGASLRRVWSVITGSDAQVLATAVEPPPFGGAMFHVERGKVLPAS